MVATLHFRLGTFSAGVLARASRAVADPSLPR